MDGHTVDLGLVHEITNEGGGEGPGCLMALAAVAAVGLLGMLALVVMLA